MKGLIYILIFLFVPVLIKAQDYGQADKEYAMLNYDKAISGYEKYISKLKKGSPDGKVLINLANSYYMVKDYSNARKYYSQLYSMYGNSMEEKLFIRMISCMKAAGDNERADEQLKSYYSGNQKRIKMMGFQRNRLDSLKTEYNNVVNLSVNSDKADFGVALFRNEAVFASARNPEGKTTGEGATYLNLYIATRNSNNGQLSNPKEFMLDVNSDYHDATLTFSEPSGYVFFSRNFLTKKEKLDADNGEVSNVMIMKGKVMGDQLTEITPLEFNSKNYNCSHPFVSQDGKLLFFASDMPGGFGQSDIYVAELFNDGSTGTPINLGEMINTPGVELFPSLSGDTLFFSSDAHYGFGGLDIFWSKMAGTTNFSIPENLGEPINSNRDDFAFIRLNDRTGYLSSDRVGGNGNDDIYWYDMKIVEQFIDYSGLVLTKGSDVPVPGAKVKVYDAFNDLITEFESDDEGNFEVSLPCNSQFKAVFSKPEYSTETVAISTPEKSGESKDNDVRLTSYSSLVEKDGDMEKIKVDPIYFEYNKWDITPQAETELNKILFAMEKFPNVKIKIESHTDARGSDSYNLKLSDNRAKSTMDYLISQGVDPNRIESATGYGETRLKNKCRNGVKCSEEDHFVNRRSDFIVISK